MTRREAALLAAALMALAGCNRPASAKAEAKDAPPLPADVRAVAAAVSPERVASATADVKDAFSGEFLSPVRSELVSKVQGRVGRVLVDEGARVRKGQPLLELETDYLTLELKRAEADVERMKALREDSRRDFERKQGLLAKESVAQAVFDRSQGAWEQAQAGYAAALAAAELARQRLADAVLTSPIDGIVAERRADVGERLADNTVAFVVQQAAPLKLRFRVPERYLAKARIGMAIKALVDPYPGEGFSGRVTVVGNAIDPATRTFFIEAEFANADGRLRPGLFARIEADLGAND